MNFSIQKYNNFGDFTRKANRNQTDDHKLFYNHFRNNSMKSLDNQLSPRSEYSFEKREITPVRNQPYIQSYTEKHSKRERDYKEASYNNNYSNVASITNYLDRRHVQTQERLNKLRSEKYSSESSQLKFRPAISKNSRKIINNLINKEKSATGPLPLANYMRISKPPVPIVMNYTEKVNEATKENNSNNQNEGYKKIIEQRDKIIQQDTNLNTVII